MSRGCGDFLHLDATIKTAYMGIARAPPLAEAIGRQDHAGRVAPRAPVDARTGGQGAEQRHRGDAQRRGNVHRTRTGRNKNMTVGDYRHESSKRQGADKVNDPVIA